MGDLSFKRINPCSQSASNSLDKDRKRQAEDSPENQKNLKRKRFMPEWQIGKFLWMYLEGTKTALEYEEVDIENDTEITDNTPNQEKTVAKQPEAAEAEDNLDLK